MGAGKYRHPITIQTPKTLADGAVADDAGHIDLELDDNWKAYAERRAEIIETAGREFVQRRQVKATNTHLITVRADRITRLITTSMRVRFFDSALNDYRILNIDGVNVLGDRARELEIHCIESK